VSPADILAERSRNPPGFGYRVSGSQREIKLLICSTRTFGIGVDQNAAMTPRERQASIRASQARYFTVGVWCDQIGRLRAAKGQSLEKSNLADVDLAYDRPDADEALLQPSPPGRIAKRGRKMGQ